MSNKKKKNIQYPVNELTNHPVERTRMKIVAEEPFFGTFLQSMEVFETRMIPTAAVGWNDGKTRYRLYYNPDFMAYLTEPQQRAVFYHEMLHICFEHLSSRSYVKQDDPQAEVKHKVWNMAMDLAINSHLDHTKMTSKNYELPRDVIIPALITWRKNEEDRIFGTQVVPAALYKAKMDNVEIPKEVSDIYGNFEVTKITAENGSTINVILPESMAVVDFTMLSDVEKSIVKQFVLSIFPPPTEEEKKFADKNANSASSHQAGAEEEEEIPEGLMMPCIPGYRKFKNFPKFLVSEQYYSMIMQDPEVQEALKNSSLEQYGGFDVHDWDGSGGQDGSEKDGDSRMANGAGKNGSDSLSESLKRIETKRITNKCVNEAKKKGWGDVPAELASNIELMLETSINWQAALRYFVLKSRRGSSFSSFRKTNRRYRNSKGESYAPGRKITRTSNILIAVDESGSVSDDMMSAFVSELNTLCKLVTFTVVPFDTKCGEAWEWKKGKKINSFERTRCGGTCFNAPTKMFNENKGKFDGLVIITDMYAPRPEQLNGLRLWVCPHNTDASTVRSVTADREPVVMVEY